MNKTMFSFAVLGAALLSGCTNVATFDYNGAPGAVAVFQERGAARKTVAVMPISGPPRSPSPAKSATAGRCIWASFRLRRSAI